MSATDWFQKMVKAAEENLTLPESLNEASGGKKPGEEPDVSKTAAREAVSEKKASEQGDKPVSEEELDRGFREAFKAMSQKEEIFEYTYKKVPYKILVNKIRYFESDKRQVNLYSTDGVSSFYKKLDEVEAQLEQMNIKFLRISKSYLVNVNYVKEFRYEKVVMDDGKEFKIGPRYKDKIRKSYIELMRIS